MLDIKNPSKFHVELHNQYATRKIWNKNVMKIPITLQLSNTFEDIKGVIKNR
jgi:hypothetical protein